MDQRHKALIVSNLSQLVALVNYEELKPHLLNLRIFPSVQLKRYVSKQPCVSKLIFKNFSAGDKVKVI